MELTRPRIGSTLGAWKKVAKSAIENVLSNEPYSVITTKMSTAERMQMRVLTQLLIAKHAKNRNIHNEEPATFDEMVFVAKDLLSKHNWSGKTKEHITYSIIENLITSKTEKREMAKRAKKIVRDSGSNTQKDVLRHGLPTAETVVNREGLKPENKDWQQQIFQLRYLPIEKLQEIYAELFGTDTDCNSGAILITKIGYKFQALVFEHRKWTAPESLVVRTEAAYDLELVMLSNNDFIRMEKARGVDARLVKREKTRAIKEKSADARMFKKAAKAKELILKGKLADAKESGSARKVLIAKIKYIRQRVRVEGANMDSVTFNDIKGNKWKSAPTLKAEAQMLQSFFNVARLINRMKKLKKQKKTGKDVKSSIRETRTKLREHKEQLELRVARWNRRIARDGKRFAKIEKEQAADLKRKKKKTIKKAIETDKRDTKKRSKKQRSDARKVRTRQAREAKGE